MPFVDLPDFRLFYETAGPEGDGASTVLLLMGLGMRGEAWFHQIPALSERHRVVWLDNRGVGQSGSPPVPWTLPAMADDALALLDHLGIDRAHVVGVSMGGMLAQHLALRARDRLLSLSLIATHPGGRRVTSARGLFHLLGARLAPRSRRRRHVELLLFPPEFLATCDKDWLDRTLQRDFSSPAPMRTMRAQYGAVRRHDTRARLGELAGVPTLIVRPGRDLLIDPDQALALHAGIPGSQLLELPDAGHGVVRQSWEELNPALLEHFAEAEAAEREAA